MSLAAMLWVFGNSDATLGSRLVLLALADNADDEGCNAWPSVPTLAGKARMSEKGTRDALRRLEADGRIRRVGVSDFGTNIYEIVGIAPGENSGESGDKQPGGGEVTSAPPEDVAAFRTPTSPERSFERKHEKPSSSSAVDSFAAAWGQHSPPLRQHRPAYFQTPRFARAVASALRLYELEEILKAVENYATVLASPDHWYSWPYDAIDFLHRERKSPGVESFVDEARPFEKYRTQSNRDVDGGQQRTPADRLRSAEAWVLETAWKLPLDEGEVAEALGQRGVEGPDRARLMGLWRTKASRAA